MKSMNYIQKEDGSYANTQQDLESEVLDFYKNLMGKDATELEGIYTSAMREGA